MPKPANTGAPDAQKRLEAHEADAEANVLRIKEQLDALRALSKPNGNPAEEDALREQIGTLERSLNAAYDLWFKLTKQVREYDKAVTLDRREGEKVPVAEAQEAARQLILSIHIARENYLINFAQQCPLFREPEDFIKAHADLMRSTEQTAMASALKEGVLPSWMASI